MLYLRAIVSLGLLQAHEEQGSPVLLRPLINRVKIMFLRSQQMASTATKLSKSITQMANTGNKIVKGNTQALQKVTKTMKTPPLKTVAKHAAAGAIQGGAFYGAMAAIEALSEDNQSEEDYPKTLTVKHPDLEEGFTTNEDPIKPVEGGPLPSLAQLDMVQKSNAVPTPMEGLFNEADPILRNQDRQSNGPTTSSETKLFQGRQRTSRESLEAYKSSRQSKP